jgi:hypothetical protein
MWCTDGLELDGSKSDGLRPDICCDSVDAS